MANFAPAVLAALCAAGAANSAEVKYMLWDSVQAPAYRQCAADFTRKNPGITVRITQSGWEDYWTAISMGFISDTAPDVFVNHLAKSSEFVKNALLVDLMPYIRKDGLDLAIYPAGLVDVWSRAGRQYGLPKDLDTIGMIVNLAHARRAGVTLAQLQNMNWNPRDGGSFEQIVRKMTFDAKGNSGASLNFDPRHVATYGYQNPGTGGMVGQTEWSHFAVSDGFHYQDQAWVGKFHYDDPKLAETIDWLAGLPGKGLSASYQNTRSMGSDAMFVAGRAAMIPQGSWMITYFAANAKFENAWIPLPRGPSGRRASMLNGVADSIWVGSKVKDEAWKWVKYLASAQCQGVVASYGVTFPAIHGMAEKAVAAVRQKTGVDASAFLLMAGEQTFLTPIAENAAQADELMKGALESVFLGKQKAAPALKQANDRINQLFK
ncbi:MAG: sugar ABC transporter substrate-binding protein [Pseudomonadota bacterium]